MNRIASTIQAFTLSLLIVLLSGGVSVFYHWCSCTDTAKVSILTDIACCKHSSAPDSCNDSTLVGSNSLKTHLECGCETSFRMLVVEDLASVRSAFFDKFSAVALVELGKDPSLPQPQLSCAEECLLRQPPPSIWGKQLLIATQSLKIPHSLS